jgi:uncharacterized membrane protein YgcG
VERLQGLADWLRQQGHLVNEFTIQVEQADSPAAGSYVVEAVQVLPLVMDALAAAGKRPGGLRLQQLRVPALGTVPMFTILGTLSACRQLRQLHLGNSFSGKAARNVGGALKVAPHTLQKLPRDLQQLTALTSLSLGSGLVWYVSEQRQDLDLLRYLPSSLVELYVGGKYGMGLFASSMQHLTALQRLTLPALSPAWANRSSRHGSSSSSSGGGGTGGDGGEGGGGGGNGSSSSRQPLTALTALTYLRCRNALQRCGGSELLALPNLVELRAADMVEPAAFATLTSKPPLRALSCYLRPEGYAELAATLKQLTLLTQLKLEYDRRLYNIAEPEEEEEEEQEPHPSLILGSWGGALSCLKGLRSLAVDAALLFYTDATVLTALTHLALDLGYAQHRRGGVWVEPLWRLNQAAKQLQRLELGGVPQEEQPNWRLAAGIVAVGAEVAFV